MDHVEDAHTSVQNALQAVASLEIGSLNETEREHAAAAISHLRDLDEALAVRSGFEEEQLGMAVLGDEEVDPMSDPDEYARQVDGGDA